ncbi:MAG: hypothetical protein QXU01_02115 [Candidatus Hadarchaeales archaeon]
MKIRGDVVAYVVKSAVRELLKKLRVRASEDFFKGLDSMIEDAVKKAAKRASENNRKTLRACDL